MWKRLLENLQPFWVQRGDEVGRAGDVATWPREALDEARSHGIGAGRHNNGNRRGCTLSGEGPRRAMGHEDVDLEPNQFGCQVREPIVLALGPAVVNDNVFAFEVTQVTQACP